MISPDILHAAQKLGHEIGLHGGRNHARWEHYAHTWTRDRLRREIETSLGAMRAQGLPEATSFASPAWNSPACLKELLPSLGFHILADTYDPSAESVSQSGSLRTVPTNITPGAGNAGYLETLQMQGMQKSGIIRHFKKQLASKSRLAVVYDHPFFAGIHALPVLKALVETAMDCGFSVCTVREAVNGLETLSRRPEAAWA